MAPPKIYDRDDPSKVDWQSLPRGWQTAKDPVAGQFYVDHFNRKTSWFHPRQLKHEEQLSAVEAACRVKANIMESRIEYGSDVASVDTNSRSSETSDTCSSEDAGTTHWLAIRAAEQMCKEFGAALGAVDQNERSTRLALQLVALRTDFSVLRKTLVDRLHALELDAVVPDVTQSLDFFRLDGTLKTDCELKVCGTKNISVGASTDQF